MDAVNLQGVWCLFPESVPVPPEPTPTTSTPGMGVGSLTSGGALVPPQYVGVATLEDMRGPVRSFDDGWTKPQQPGPVAQFLARQKVRQKKDQDFLVL